MTDPTQGARGGLGRALALGFARGSMFGGAIFTWLVAQTRPTLAVIGIVAVVLGSMACEELS